MISADKDPVVSSLLLRRGLRSARDDAGLSQSGVGKRLEWSSKKVYRIEAGETSAAVADVLALTQLYGLDPERTQELADLAAAAFGPAWWEEFRSVVGPEFGLYLSCERAAAELCSFHPTLIQGLVQTEGYARAVLSGTSTAMDLNQHVSLRRQRRDVFRRPQPPKVTILLGEAALHNRVGGAETMREQLLELRSVAARGEVDLGIVPFENCVYPPMLIGFDLVRLPDDGVVLYLELPPISRTTKDETVLNELYGDFFSQIRARAMFGTDAAALIDAILDKRARGESEQ